MYERDYFRIRVHGLKVHFNLLPEGQDAPVTVSFSRKVSSLPREKSEPEDAFQDYVLSLLHRLEAKMDRLTGYLERGQGGMPYRLHGDVVDISGGGLSFSSPVACEVGSLLDMCIFPSYGNPHPIFAIGKVCWVDPKADESGDESHVLGTEFIEIHEEDREAIVRMVFQSQRKQKLQDSKQPGDRAVTSLPDSLET